MADKKERQSNQPRQPEGEQLTTPQPSGVTQQINQGEDTTRSLEERREAADEPGKHR